MHKYIYIHIRTDQREGQDHKQIESIVLVNKASKKGSKKGKGTRSGTMLNDKDYLVACLRSSDSSRVQQTVTCGDSSDDDDANMDDVHQYN